MNRKIALLAVAGLTLSGVAFAQVNTVPQVGIHHVPCNLGWRCDCPGGLGL